MSRRQGPRPSALGRLLLAGVPISVLVRRLREWGPAGVHPSPATADPALAQSFRTVGAGLVAYSVPWFVAAFVLLVVLYRMASDDGASAGAIAGIMVLACLFAAIPGLLGYGFLRAGRLVRHGSTHGVESGMRLGWLVVVLGGLTTVLSMADDRPGYRTVAVVAAGVVGVALFNTLRLRSLNSRVTEFEDRAATGTAAVDVG